MKIDLPEKLAVELDKINWEKVSKTDLDLLIIVGLPLLKRKGYLKEELHNEHFEKNTHKTSFKTD